jgi:geranylgeranyl pyrophosphate synthase
VVDDILDCTQTTEMLGKTAGKDVDVNKTTYPKLLGLEKSKQVSKTAGLTLWETREKPTLVVCMTSRPAQ